MGRENIFKNDNVKLSVLNSTGFKMGLFVLLSLVAFYMYRFIDSLTQTQPTVLPKSELKRALLRILQNRSDRNMTANSDEVAQELKLISKIVQEKLHRLQGNVNCNRSHIVCGHRSNCGFGCHVHHRMFCLMLSYAMNRPLIFNTHRHLAYKAKWADNFEEMGVKCRGNWDSHVVDWGTYPVTIQVRRNMEVLASPLNAGLPFPEDLTERLRRVHTKPFLWLVGQFAKFVMRLLPDVEEMIESLAVEISFQKPIVGVHIRRTDKLDEQPAAYHPLRQYMEEAQNYFTEFHAGIQTKTVYIATEDSSVFEEVGKSYGMPEWNILGFSPTTTGNLSQRTDYLFEIIRDVILLSRCDFVVCGFTSNICRLVYELMQFQNEDASAKVVSLDKTYYYNVLGNGLKQRLVPTNISKS